MADDDEPPLDDGHFFGLLELPGHRRERVTALGTALPIGFIQLVHLLDDGQSRLDAWPAPGTWRTLRDRRLGRWHWPPLARRAEQRVVPLREQLLEKGQLALERRPILAAQAREFGEQRLDLFVEPLVFAIEEAGRLS
jgi:hypothetical protein